MKPSIRRCAVYTRKSSEQGLEQDFNSLDAQREAAVAYIASQKHDGWTLIDTHYDDGGWCGGNMDRPALKALLADVEAGRIDIIVVYKVDRLTRSLADFAKLVEAFDRKGVSFVSVTQQFNTTTSMGRLTLNVLLSFAQFEREVTGERIRDKVLASKKKGIFMGGVPPLGYDIGKRKLEVNPAEAEQVRSIFSLYLKLGCVGRLKQALDQAGMRSKAWITGAGQSIGGNPFSKGALYHLLKNRTYIGKTSHKGKIYPGEHEAIVPLELFEAVDQALNQNRIQHRSGKTARSPSLLRGLTQDKYGRPMTPSHSNKQGQRYRYYISSVFAGSEAAELGPVLRLPAKEVEAAVLEQLGTLLGDARRIMGYLGIEPVNITARGKIEDRAAGLRTRLATDEAAAVIRQFVAKVRVSTADLEIEIGTNDLRQALGLHQLEPFGNIPADPGDNDPMTIRLKLEVRLQRHGAGKRLFTPAGSAGDAKIEINAPLIKALAQAYRWRQEIESAEGLTVQKITDQADVSRTFVSARIGLAYLVPDIIEAILDGRQPRAMQPGDVVKELPLDWQEQRMHLKAGGIDSLRQKNQLATSLAELLQTNFRWMGGTLGTITALR